MHPIGVHTVVLRFVLKVSFAANKLLGMTLQDVQAAPHDRGRKGLDRIKTCGLYYELLMRGDHVANGWANLRLG
jgi:hypothetical protein